MSSVLRFLVLLAGLFALPVVAGQATTFERVRIPSDDGGLDGVLFRPTGSGPFPAVVALHGCGGLWRDGKLSVRHTDWGERLAADGYIVLMPDSYGSRSLGSQCGVRDLTVRASRERVADAGAARRFLQQRSDVQHNRVALIGWSGGATTVLAAARKDRRPGDAQPDFVRAIAFYPSCRFQLESPGFSLRLPLLMLMGDSDDWTPAQPCDFLAQGARQRGERVSLVIYPGALHDFDHPRLEVKQRQDIAYSATGTGKASVGTNPAAREDALKRVAEFLSRP